MRVSFCASVAPSLSKMPVVLYRCGIFSKKMRRGATYWRHAGDNGACLQSRTMVGGEAKGMARLSRDLQPLSRPQQCPSSPLPHRSHSRVFEIRPQATSSYLLLGLFLIRADMSHARWGAEGAFITWCC
ncbi:hypothetical protein RRF57_010298 [Xylaria bambusicola]|uniref:Uncharacterized protein n=1 Tax=Xylaria bambusicola TaxID=326684 RepID=A0AAN7UL03_9PEZI